MENLVGAPIDPDHASEIEDWDFYLGNVGYSVRERYWANYVTLSDIACQSLSDLWDEGISENWSKWEASTQIESWVDAIIEFQQTEFVGFSGLSDDEATANGAAAMRVDGCDYIFEAFFDFIDS